MVLKENPISPDSNYSDKRWVEAPPGDAAESADHVHEDTRDGRRGPDEAASDDVATHGEYEQERAHELDHLSVSLDHDAEVSPFLVLA